MSLCENSAISRYLPLEEEPLIDFKISSDIYLLIEELRDLGSAIPNKSPERIFFDRVTPNRELEEGLRLSSLSSSAELGKLLKLRFLFEEIFHPTFARDIEGTVASPILDESLSDFENALRFVVDSTFKYAFFALRSFIELTSLQLIYAVNERSYYFEDECEKAYAVDLEYIPYKGKIIPELLNQGLITTARAEDLRHIYSSLSSYSHSLSKNLYHGYMFFEPQPTDFPKIWTEVAVRYMENIVAMYVDFVKKNQHLGHSCV